MEEFLKTLLLISLLLASCSSERVEEPISPNPIIQTELYGVKAYNDPVAESYVDAYFDSVNSITPIQNTADCR